MSTISHSSITDSLHFLKAFHMFQVLSMQHAVPQHLIVLPLWAEKQQSEAGAVTHHVPRRARCRMQTEQAHKSTTALYLKTNFHIPHMEQPVTLKINHSMGFIWWCFLKFSCTWSPPNPHQTRWVDDLTLDTYKDFFFRNLSHLLTVQLHQWGCIWICDIESKGKDTIRVYRYVYRCSLI